MIEKLSRVMITDRQAYGPRGLTTVVRRALKLGATAVMVRERDLDAKGLLALSREVKEQCDEFDALLLVNGNEQVALELPAHGLHLPGYGPKPALVRPRLPRKMLLGLSIHDASETRDPLLRGVDYFLFSPIFPPRSKTSTRRPVGISGLRDLCRATNVPVIALGGIDPFYADECFEAGAAGVAAITGWIV